MSHLKDAETVSVGIIYFPNKEKIIRECRKRLGFRQYVSSWAHYSIRDLHNTEIQDLRFKI